MVKRYAGWNRGIVTRQAQPPVIRLAVEQGLEADPPPRSGNRDREGPQLAVLLEGLGLCVRGRIFAEGSPREGDA